MPANRFRDRLAPAIANGRIGDVRDEWLKEPARMADAEAVDESRQTRQCTIWNYADFRLQRIFISRTMESGSRYRNGRREQRWLPVIGDCLPWTCSCLAGILLGKKFFTAVAATACGKAVSLVDPPFAHVLALGGMVQYEQASRRYE